MSSARHYGISALVSVDVLSPLGEDPPGLRSRRVREPPVCQARGPAVRCRLGFESFISDCRPEWPFCDPRPARLGIHGHQPGRSRSPCGLL